MRSSGTFALGRIHACIVHHAFPHRAADLALVPGRGLELNFQDR